MYHFKDVCLPAMLTAAGVVRKFGSTTCSFGLVCEGLTAASEGPALGKPALFSLTAVCQPADAAAKAAVAAAGPAQPLACSIQVEPSTAPAALVLIQNGRPLPQRTLVNQQPT